MASKKSSRKAYVGIVMDIALARSKINNRMVTQHSGVDETTIRRWCKENIEFERAFIEAREAPREKINRVAGKNLDVRKRKVVTTSPDGVKTTIEDVLPTHNDIAVFSKVFGLGTSVYSEEERQRDVLREVVKHRVVGKYSVLEAAQLLEAEGVKVPITLLMELGAPKIFEPFNNMDEAAKADVASLTPQEAADIYKKYMGQRMQKQAFRTKKTLCTF